MPIPSLNTIVLNTSIRQLTSSLAVKLSVIGDRRHADATRHRWQSFVYHGIVHFININECICVLLQRVTDNMLCISKCCIGICGRIFIYPGLLCFDSYTHPSSVRLSAAVHRSFVRLFLFCVFFLRGSDTKRVVMRHALSMFAGLFESNFATARSAYSL